MSGEPVGYTNWEPGQPDNGNGLVDQDKVHIYGGSPTEHLQGWQSGQWNDIQDVTGYTTASGSYRRFYGVVEVAGVVPEPSVAALWLAVRFWSGCAVETFNPRLDASTRIPFRQL